MNQRALLQQLIAGPKAMDALGLLLSLDRAALLSSIAGLCEAGLEVRISEAGIAHLETPPTLLDASLILAAVDDVARARVADIEVTFETDSTQLRALDAPAGDDYRVFLAERQSAGQGRLGREWVSPLACNIAMSVARRFPVNPAALTGLSLATGVAVVKSLRSLGFDAVGLKWPNDLVAGDRKLGGILVQLRTEPGQGTLAAIGIGINVRMPARAGASIDQPWCDLSRLRGGVDSSSRNALVAALLDSLIPALDLFEARGLAPFLDDWTLLDAFVGRQVRMVDGGRELQGVALGIDDSGALRIESAEGEMLFRSGEVRLLPA